MGDEELADLRAEAQAAGIKVDGRWGVERLRAEIALVRGDTIHDVRVLDEPAAEGEQDAGPDSVEPEDEQPEDEPEEAETTVHRAGGHIDRGDGRGWVIEQDEE